MLTEIKRNRYANAFMGGSLAAYIVIIVYAVITASELWQWAAALIPLALLFLFLAFEYPVGYLYGLYFFLPLSVNIEEIGMGTGLSIPGEVLIAPLSLLVLANLIAGGYIAPAVRKHPVTIALGVNILWMMITAFTGTMLVVSLKYVVMRVLFLLVFYLFVTHTFNSLRRGVTLFSFYLLPVAAVVGWAVIRHARFGFIQEVNGHAPQPFFADHTVYGATLALIMPIVIAAAFMPRRVRRIPAIFYHLLLPVVLTGIVLSYSRAVWISVALTALVFLLLWMRIQFRYVIYGVIVIAVALVGLRGTIVQQLSNVESQRGTNITEHVTSSVNIKTSVSNRERINRWESALDMFSERPVLGFGPGTYQFRYAPYQDERLMTPISTWHGDVGGVHSEYLKPLAESGVIGFLSFLAIVFFTLQSGFRVVVKAKEQHVRMFAAALLLGLIAYYIHGFVNYFIHTDKIPALFWAFTAMLVVMDIRYTRNEQ